MPLGAQAELLLGRVLLERGERSGALELHQSALARLTTMESGPTDGELLVALALAYGGRTDDALELVARLEVMGYRMPELARIRELASEARSR